MMFIREPIDSHICSKSLETTKEKNERDLFDESITVVQRDKGFYIKPRGRTTRTAVALS